MGGIEVLEWERAKSHAPAGSLLGLLSGRVMAWVSAPDPRYIHAPDYWGLWMRHFRSGQIIHFERAEDAQEYAEAELIKQEPYELGHS